MPSSHTDYWIFSVWPACEHKRSMYCVLMFCPEVILWGHILKQIKTTAKEWCHVLLSACRSLSCCECGLECAGLSDFYVCVWRVTEMPCRSFLSPDTVNRHTISCLFALKRPRCRGWTSNTYNHSHVPQALFIQLTVTSGVYSPLREHSDRALCSTVGGNSEKSVKLMFGTVQKVWRCALWAAT